MSILSSTYELDGHTQIDGRVFVRESHVDSGGKVHVVEYLAADGTDYQTVANTRAVSMNGILAQGEFEDIINGDDLLP